MIHIGSPKYYENIRKRLESCDAIMVEGVKSSKVSFITLCYRFAARRKKIGLVTQHYMNMDGLRERVFNGDLGTHAFDSEWSKIPLRTRCLLFLMIPVAMIYSYTLTRKDIATHIELDDLRSRDEILDADCDTEALDSVILGKRDRHLLQALEQYHANNKASDKVLGIVFGAMHMRAVVELLSRRLSYRVTQSEWETIFDL